MGSSKLFNLNYKKPYEPIYIPTPDLDENSRTLKRLDKLQDFLKKVFYFFLVLTIIISLQLIIGFLTNCHKYHNLEESENLERSDMEYRKMFNHFVIRYNKKYSDFEERENRFQIFKQTIQQYEIEEKRHPGLDLDITQFTDWTIQELSKLASEKQIEKPKGETARVFKPLYENGESRPASFDWRDQGKLTPVKNQASCGSCWAFATVAAVEAQHAIKRGKLVSLSEQEMVDCDHQNNGCHGGYRPYAMDFVKQKGLETEKEYPYSGIEGQQCKLETNLTRVFIDDYEMLGEDEEYIADWVSKNGPVTFGMNVIKTMYSYRSGIFNPSPEDCEEKSMGSHALTIVGYGVEGSQPFWIVKNSWGTSWGASGYFRMARGVNSCGLAKTVVAPVIR